MFSKTGLTRQSFIATLYIVYRFCVNFSFFFPFIIKTSILEKHKLHSFSTVSINLLCVFLFLVSFGLSFRCFGTRSSITIVLFCNLRIPPLRFSIVPSVVLLPKTYTVASNKFWSSRSFFDTMESALM
jgi:hypothetical protein